MKQVCATNNAPDTLSFALDKNDRKLCREMHHGSIGYANLYLKNIYSSIR